MPRTAGPRSRGGPSEKSLPARVKAPVFGDLGVDRRLGLVVALYLVLIGGIVAYNARAVARERGAALIVNVAARQRSLAERYVKDVLLTSQGFQANPGEDEALLVQDADALLSGGNVVAVQGADAEVHISPLTDPRVVSKLQEERRLIEHLIESGDQLEEMPRTDPRFDARIMQLRIIGAQVGSISNDAVGQMTHDTEFAFGRLVTVVIGLGALGAMAAVAMGLLLRRAGSRRSAQFRSLVHHTSDLITVVDAGGLIRFQSPSAQVLVGLRSDDLVETSYLDLVHSDDRAHLSSLFTDLADSATSVATAEYRVRHADGSSRYVESIMSSLMGDPTVKGLVLNTRDISDRKALEEELAHQAFHDSLTGLTNRAVFRDRVDHALARGSRQGQRLAVLLLDLDGFKMINDSLGHDAGDELLVAVGRRLQACGRSSDTVARLGGDEFAILLEDEVDDARARTVATRLLQQLAAPFEVRGREVFVRASVGIALSAEGVAAQTDELIRNADTAMYAAKAGGRGRYEVFQPVMHERALEQFEVQADLQRALVRNEFTVHYQPIVDIATGRIQAMETLIRWRHPTRGLLPPYDFIRVAEETGLIVPIGRWVLTEACRQTVAWRERYPEAENLRVSVNLSTRQLLEPDLVDSVRHALQQTGLHPSALILELTEGSLMQNVTETAVKLQGLKAIGVGLAIDDFGTGSSSLGYLRTFPIDLLKIDKSFVDEVTAVGSEGPALVRAIIELAQTLHLETVAEGIELTEQLDELRSAGCRSGQGFLFARPLEADAMAELIERSERAPSAVA